MATDYQNLVPRPISQTVLTALFAESAALRLGRRQTMASGQESIPVVSFLPVAGFVNPTYGGRKPATKIEWSSEHIVAEELACVLAVPTAFIDDAGAPLWENVRPAMTAAMTRVLDAAILFGTGAPASFPAGGIAGLAGAASTGATAAEAIDAAASVIEAQGLAVDGIAGGPSVHGALRAAWGAVGALPSERPTMSLYGWPIYVTPRWDSSKGDAVLGAWEYLVIGVREDITFDVSTEAIIQDNTGAIIGNAFQDNLTAIKCWMRVGVAMGQPLNDAGVPIVPFEFADWTTV